MEAAFDKCASCGKEINPDFLRRRRVRCPFCGYKMTYKQRSRSTTKICR